MDALYHSLSHSFLRKSVPGSCRAIYSASSVQYTADRDRPHIPGKTLTLGDSSMDRYVNSRREKDYPCCIVAFLWLRENSFLLAIFLVDNPCLVCGVHKKRDVAHKTRHDLKPVCLIHESLVPHKLSRTLSKPSSTYFEISTFVLLSGKNIKVQATVRIDLCPVSVWVRWVGGNGFAHDEHLYF